MTIDPGITTMPGFRTLFFFPNEADNASTDREAEVFRHINFVDLARKKKKKKSTIKNRRNSKTKIKVEENSKLTAML